MEVVALVNRVTLQIKNIDPLTSKKEVVKDIKGEWGISTTDHIEVKTLKMALWGTQMAVVVMPSSVEGREGDEI